MGRYGKTGAHCVQFAKHLEFALDRRRRSGRQGPLSTAISITSVQSEEGRGWRIRLKSAAVEFQWKIMRYLKIDSCVSGKCRSATDRRYNIGKQICLYVHLDVLGLLAGSLTCLHAKDGLTSELSKFNSTSALK